VKVSALDLDGHADPLDLLVPAEPLNLTEAIEVTEVRIEIEVLELACFLTEDGQRVEGILPSIDGKDAGGTTATRTRLYLFTDVGPRLNQKIALAIVDAPPDK
jgi:hypothetical protein